MKTFISILALSVASFSSTALGAEDPPAWAYPVNPPDFKPRAEDGIARRVPASSATYSVTQLRDRFISPVWHPGDHPALPSVVAQGRKPNVFACGFCHRAEGTGGPENASLAGLPAAYIAQQMADYKSGARKTSVQKRNIDLMISLSKDITEAEVQAAAAYFSALKPKSNIRVVETVSVPKTVVAGWFLTAADTREKEPIGQRIIEMPEDLEQFENRDPRSNFIAYVPIGSVARGEALVSTGGAGKTLQCAICHGADLKGLGDLPSIAGRSPSYVVRQLYDIQNGARAGRGAQLMKAAVANLTVEDMASIAAYLASRTQ
ncbi:MAG TPA: c-type cytochrome [Burkholderiales bacterium]|jgi:cytochrome c553|nr:c-type cytochrome [Burkholderiales bacterium]